VFFDIAGITAEPLALLDQSNTNTLGK